MVNQRVTEIERDSSLDKVEQILQGAMHEFLLHGYAGTSMDRIAVCAGVSKATVYSHFQDKQGLFKALIEKLAQQRFHSIFGTERLEGDPKRVLRRLLTKALNQMLKDEEFHAFKRVIIGESGRFPELARLCTISLVKPTIETLGQYLAFHPELKIPDPEATARIIVGSLVHFVMTQEMMGAKEMIPMESDRLIDALIHLILKSAD
ncbi:TetR/AcrR family transcriptional regulator [Brasilonema sp. UFV-L1]|uniref:TetR/AcrR family transcriptional regulator n=1 Tax=Brasilonema sp. UFV-L1 TaxID=2234130 RepID=UPI00145C4FBC|nr:TetR/AcrR family transcriptional regulator [Brasilonema sp. UFV-L1]NMG06490.1 TetR/AcrR family transcriptional regulator [Brasilonema sp. UFV-L1]